MLNVAAPSVDAPGTATLSVEAEIADRVRERVQREGVTLSPDLADRYVRDEVRRYSELALGGSVPLLADEADATRHVVATLTGFGALQPLLDDPEIEELWINAPDAVYVARGGVSERTSIRLTDGEVRDLVERMLQASGRRVDLSSPFVDASLPDGSRLHVAIPDVTRQHWAVNVRKFSAHVRDLQALVELGALTRPAAEFLRMCVLAKQNILVSGATQSGKPTNCQYAPCDWCLPVSTQSREAPTNCPYTPSLGSVLLPLRVGRLLSATAPLARWSNVGSESCGRAFGPSGQVVAVRASS